MPIPPAARFAGLAAALLTLAAPPAEAGRGVVHFGIGIPLYAPPPAWSYPPPAWYAEPVYAYPPVWYAPPPVAYPAPVYEPPPVRQICREYRTTMIIDGRPQEVYGTACREDDGSWRIAR